MTTESERITSLLAEMDSVYFSCDLSLSDVMRDRLTQEKLLLRYAQHRRCIVLSGWKRALPRKEPGVACLPLLCERASPATPCHRAETG